ncbi:MAG: ImmA/IrrE family metallo-endopeptidase [Thermodesulfobacteriota bacterium]|jgi:hypothetical protein|nr:MAG: ImmA/IrrE family metallo-endopeptidase [Thermodesulfobacteriota bacterium]
MKVYRTTSGPFSERPYFEAAEVENICNDELQKVGLLPTGPEPIRIDRFIEKKFKVTFSFEDMPEGVLGYTMFGVNGVKGIAVSRELGEENNKFSERRVNTTLAHEAGHGLLHAYLFAFDLQAKSLFGNSKDVSGSKIICRSSGIEGLQDRTDNHYSGQWWEYQANLAIGALLLPRKLVKLALEPLLREVGSLGCKVLEKANRQAAINRLVDIFDVNPIVAKIRVDSLFPMEQNPLLTL